MHYLNIKESHGMMLKNEKKLHKKQISLNALLYKNELYKKRIENLFNLVKRSKFIESISSPEFAIAAKNVQLHYLILIGELEMKIINNQFRLQNYKNSIELLKETINSKRKGKKMAKKKMKAKAPKGKK